MNFDIGKYFKYFLYFNGFVVLMLVLMISIDFVRMRMNRYEVLRETPVVRYYEKKIELDEFEPFKKGEIVWLYDKETINGVEYGYCKTYTLSRTPRWGHIEMKYLKKVE